MARQQQLLDAVLDGVQRVEELATLLDVSPSTVRRGLADLERQESVVRTHGGAVPARAAAELSWPAKARRNVAAKRQIAKHAATLINDNHARTVLLDAGSTTTLIAEQIAQNPALAGLTVITNGIGPLQACHENDDLEVVVLGGQLRRRRGSLVGDYTRLVLERLTVDIAFIGTDGLVPGRGLNCPSAELAAVKELHSRAARHSVVVADSSKLGADAQLHWALLNGPYTLITDDGLTAADRRALATEPTCNPQIVPMDAAPSAD